MNEQQFLSIALTTVPTMITVLIGIMINNARFNDLNSRIAELRSDMNQRFDDVKDLWRSELHRVEQILDARLKHYER